MIAVGLNTRVGIPIEIDEHICQGLVSEYVDWAHSTVGEVNQDWKCNVTVDSMLFARHYIFEFVDPADALAFRLRFGL